MSGLRNLLDYFSCSLILFILFYLIVIASWAVCRWRGTTAEKFPGGPFAAIKQIVGDNNVICTLVVVVLLVGLIHGIAFLFFRSNKIGAFYERDYYRETYEAYVYPNEDSTESIFCLVEILKSTDDNNKPIYSIESIDLPLGRSAYVYEEFDPKDDVNYIEIGWEDYRIEVCGIATDASFRRLQDFVPTNYGPYCASKNSKTFHDRNCRHVEAIAKKNLFYFRSLNEAELLDFQACESCEPYS